jgi:hypothetical protein
MEGISDTPLALFDEEALGGTPGVPAVRWKGGGPTPGQALFAAIIDQLATLGVRIPRSHIAKAAVHGAQALEEGVEPEVVLVGCLLSLRKGTPEYATAIISDFAFAKVGARISKHQYEEDLDRLSRSQNPAVKRFRAAADKLLGPVDGDIPGLSL